MTPRSFCFVPFFTVVAISVAFSPRMSTGGEIAVFERLQLRIEQLEAQVDRLKSRLADSEKRRDAALQLAEDAKRQLEEALRQAADANSQRNAARKEAETARQRASYQIVAIRERAESEKNDIRKEAKAEKSEMRRQHQMDIDSIRDNASRQVDEARTELAVVRKQSETYKARMNRAESALERYAAQEDAAQRLAMQYYIDGIEDIQKRDYQKAIISFTAAIERYPRDARFFYMRAYVRHMTRESDDELDDAIRDAKRGAEFEVQRSATRVVNASLERYQGKSRLWLEEYRLIR